MKNKVIGLALLLIVSAALFQNCTVGYQPPEDSLSSLADTAPFAYDANLDQLAYMSCSDLGTVYDPSTYFTFRGGAYLSGGLKLADNYFADMPTVTTPDAKIEFLTSSTANTNMQLQMALRSNSNFQGVYGTGSTSDGQDYSLIFDTLGTSEMVEPLLSMNYGQRARYFRNGTFEGRRFEGSINMSSLADNLRATIMGRNSQIPGKLFLGLTYTSPDKSATYARSPLDYVAAGTSTGSATVNNTVFGKGLLIDLAPPPGAYSGFPEYTMTKITEFNMTNRSDLTGIGTWVCPDSLKFQIVRNTADNTNDTLCGTNADADYAVGSDLWRVRQSLRTEDWYVDMTRKCIVPKHTQTVDCYGNDFTRLIQYAKTSQCLSNGGNPANTDPNSKACSHWVSICYRQ